MKTSLKRHAFTLIEYGSSFSYADGHAEMHKWRDSKFIALQNTGISVPGSPDVALLFNHSTAP